MALTHCDTDSAYTLLADENLEKAVVPEKKAEFNSRLKDHCSSEGKERHPQAFLPRTCCDECNLVDNKYPGLWKV